MILAEMCVNDHSVESKPLKVYCDTDTLLHNINEPPELFAHGNLLEKHQEGKVVMYRSGVNLREVVNTKDQEQLGRLIQGYEALAPIPADERVYGIDTQFDQRGRSTVYPIVSDVQNEEMCRQLVDHGLDRCDAQHITQAVCNGCDVFLTRDRATIIAPHREWLEGRFPNFKIRLPSEIA